MKWNTAIIIVMLGKLGILWLGESKSDLFVHWGESTWTLYWKWHNNNNGCGCLTIKLLNMFCFLKILVLHVPSCRGKTSHGHALSKPCIFRLLLGWVNYFTGWNCQGVVCLTRAISCSTAILISYTIHFLMLLNGVVNFKGYISLRTLYIWLTQNKTIRSKIKQYNCKIWENLLFSAASLRNILRALLSLSNNNNNIVVCFFSVV